MPVLSNPKHERFAQERAKGLSASEAFVVAGYSKNDGNAGRLNRNELVASRVAEITGAAAEQAGVTVERILAEFAKVAFTDLPEAVTWDNNRVTLVASDMLSPTVRSAVAEVSQTKDGLRIKMHDKNAALANLARTLGMFKDKTELTGKDGAPLQASVKVEFVKAKGDG